MYAMDTKQWKINDDKTYLNATSQLYVSWLEKSFDTWVDLDKEQHWITQHQTNALEKFISLPDASKTDLSVELEKLYISELENKNIQPAEFTHILDTINWLETQICIPQHAESENRYVLLLPETKWKITGSDFTLELEVLFTNENIEISQEMSGLWCRPEWFDNYLK